MRRSKSCRRSRSSSRTRRSSRLWARASRRACSCSALPAPLRPGRFDRQVVVDRPDRVGRKKILEVHSRGKPMSQQVDIEALAGQTPGFTGADLANLVNEAALLAARKGKKQIENLELE